MSAAVAEPRHKLHVNVRMMKFNKETGGNEPALVVLPNCKAGEEPQAIHVHEAIIRLPDGTEVARLVNRPNDRLFDGAQAWIETSLMVECVGDQTILAINPNE